MKNDYELTALDMDDTLLRSDKTISEETIASFKKVRDAGKKAQDNKVLRLFFTDYSSDRPYPCRPARYPDSASL